MRENRYIGEATLSHEQPINQKLIIDQNIFPQRINLRGSVSLILVYTLYREKKNYVVQKHSKQCIEAEHPTPSQTRLQLILKGLKKITILITLCYSALVIKYISHTISALSTD